MLSLTPKRRISVTRQTFDYTALTSQLHIPNMCGVTIIHFVVRSAHLCTLILCSSFQLHL
ncbi:hypothetical protein AT1219_30411 [Vibrio alginolyticus]